MAFLIKVRTYIVNIVVVLLLCGGIMAPALSCKAAEEPVETPETIEIEGTIRYITVGDGFWGIIGNDGVNYDPINLVAEYAEGYTINIVAEILKNRDNPHQWGTLIQINTIEVVASPTPTITC